MGYSNNIWVTSDSVVWLRMKAENGNLQILPNEFADCNLWISDLTTLDIYFTQTAMLCEFLGIVEKNQSTIHRKINKKWVSREKSSNSLINVISEKYGHPTLLNSSFVLEIANVIILHSVKHKSNWINEWIQDNWTIEREFQTREANKSRSRTAMLLRIM